MISPTQRAVDIPIENGFVGMVDREHFDEFPAASVPSPPGPTARPAPSCASSATTRAPMSSTATRLQVKRRAFRGRIVIGADGARSNVARWRGARRREDPLCHRLSRDHQSAGARSVATTPPARCDVIYDGGDLARLLRLGLSRTARAPAWAWAPGSRASTSRRRPPTCASPRGWPIARRSAGRARPFRSSP